MNSKFRGTGVAIVTPFNSDKTIDYSGLEKLVNHLIEGGVDYLVVQGTTGESATLSKEEKVKVLDFVHEKTDGRVPLVFGIGGNNTMAVADDMGYYDSSKFEAILSVVPYYNKPTQEGIYRHYKYLAGVAPKPIILYNVPGRSVVNMTAETTLRLANEFDNLIAVKEASGDLTQIKEIIDNRPDNFLVISGDDPITIPIIHLGGDGVISVVANALPKSFSNMVNQALEGNCTAVQVAQNSFEDITDLMFLEGNPAGVKAALHILGVHGVDVRLPLVKMSDAGYAKMRTELEKMGELANV
ncbi:MAG: 4-hydroxy-tetrahydrodipicolinate synthase [Flavobacteriales bacterium]|jgi:4-hydroxy-tetrahydrodipicolinate synthase|nr:4-hydroxy-tetrahydrodipicolinate synthase [Flavobacteriales bacterium]MBT6745861.1 4-hydroxy-tetrahydrodipicolinate synthase [Flavobacteriales bacterium]